MLQAKRQSRWSLALMIYIGMFLGCNGAEQSMYDMEAGGMDMASKEAQTFLEAQVPQALRVAMDERTPDQPSSTDQARPRMIIRTARLSCEVASFNDARDSIQKITAQANGYVVTSTRNGGDRDYTYGEVILRIPSERFDETLQSIKQRVQIVESERIDGNDVSEQFYDLVARLDNKKKAEQRYQQILKAARTVKEILEVEQALTEVRGEIESMEGRRRYLADQAAMSTINLDLHEPRPITSSGRRGFWAKITRSFSRGLDGFGDAVGGSIEIIIAGSPIVVIFGGLGWAGLKGIRRLRRQSKPQKAEQTEE